MSLREDIDKILWNMPTLRDDIIKAIEKRIDSVLENDKPDRRFSEFQRGYLTAFRDMKGNLE